MRFSPSFIKFGNFKSIKIPNPFKAIQAHWNLPRFSGQHNSRKRFVAGTVAGLSVLAAYGVLSQTTGAPDMGTSYRNVQPPTGTKGKGSAIVAVLAKAMGDQLARGWNPSQSFLHPSHWRTDTNAYQRAMGELTWQMTTSLRSSITYAGLGSQGQYDNDLDTAARDMSQFPDIWMFSYGTKAYYADGIAHLRNYNQHLANGDAQFPARISDVEEVLSVLMRVTGDESSKLDNVLGTQFLLTGDARDAYFGTIGAFKLACGILEAAKIDFHQTILNQNASVPFQLATSDVCAVGEKSMPSIISLTMNGQIKALAGDAARANSLMRTAYDSLAGRASSLGLR